MDRFLYRNRSHICIYVCIYSLFRYSYLSLHEVPILLARIFRISLGRRAKRFFLFLFLRFDLSLGSLQIVRKCLGFNCDISSLKALKILRDRSYTDDVLVHIFHFSTSRYERSKIEKRHPYSRTIFILTIIFVSRPISMEL